MRSRRRRLRPRWLAWLLGGSYRWGWQPGVLPSINKYYRENWCKAGYSLWDFIKPPWVMASDAFMRRHGLEPLTPAKKRQLRKLRRANLPRYPLMPYYTVPEGQQVGRAESA